MLKPSRFVVLFLFLAALFGSWTAASLTLHAQATALISCRVEPASIPLNGEATLILEVANTQNLYGYELDLAYDASRIRFADADAEKAGVNVQLVNQFISPDFIVENVADNGIVALALTQLAPNSPRSGSGELVRTTFTGISEGFASFAFGEFVFSDPNGQAISLVTQDCTVEIGPAGQPTPTPTPSPVGAPTSAPTPTNTTAPASQNTEATSASQSQVAAAATPTTAPATANQAPSTATTSATATSQVAQTPQNAPVVVTTPLSSPSNAGGNTSTPTEIPPTEMPQPEAADTGAGAEAAPPQPSTPTPATETTENNSQETVTSEGKNEQIAMVESIPTATSTPLVIDRVAQSAPLPVESVQQPAATARLTTPDFLQQWGWLFLLLVSMLGVAAWRLR